MTDLLRFKLIRTKQNLYEKYGFAMARQRAKTVQPPPVVIPKSIIPDTAERNGRPICYAYGRVSTADQHCDTQEGMTTKHYEKFLADRYDWGGFYADPDVSGSVDIADRPAGTVVMELLEPGDAIMVTTFDRLTRSVLGWGTFRKRLDDEEFRLICMDLAVDTKTAAGRFVLNIMASKSEFEREQISERVRNRHASLRQRRLQAMSIPAPWGFELVPVTGLVSKSGSPYGLLTPFLPEQAVMRMLNEWNERWGVSQPTLVTYLDRMQFRGRSGSPIDQPRLCRMLQHWQRLAGTQYDVTGEHEFWKDGDRAPRPEVDLPSAGVRFRACDVRRFEVARRRASG